MYEVEEGWLVNPGADDESYRSPGVEVEATAVERKASLSVQYGMKQCAPPLVL